METTDVATKLRAYNIKMDKIQERLDLLENLMGLSTIPDSEEVATFKLRIEGTEEDIQSLRKQINVLEDEIQKIQKQIETFATKSHYNTLANRFNKFERKFVAFEELFSSSVLTMDKLDMLLQRLYKLERAVTQPIGKAEAKIESVKSKIGQELNIIPQAEEELKSKLGYISNEIEQEMPSAKKGFFRTTTGKVVLALFVVDLAALIYYLVV